MRLVVVLALVVLVPIALLLWTRRGSRGADGTDPQANRDLGRHGGPPTRPQGDTWGGGGSL